MNPLLNTYLVDVRHPNVSGAEHLQMLHNRDQILAIESTLTDKEHNLLHEADRYLVEHAITFYAELSQFVDLSVYRADLAIDPTRWWWYLDVISQLPLESIPPTPHFQLP